MNRKLSMMILTTLMALTITACSCGQSSATPSPKPSAATATPLPSPVQTPETSPGMSPDMSPDMSPNPSEGAPVPSPDGESAATPGGSDGPTMMGVDVSKLILELEKLSEVDTAEVVAHSGRALVGLSFDAQYQGTLTERIEEMVVSAVTSVEEMLTDVAVTADPTLVTEIRTLAADTESKDMTDEQIKQFEDLYEKIKPAKSAEPAAQ